MLLKVGKPRKKRLEVHPEEDVSRVFLPEIQLILTDP